MTRRILRISLALVVGVAFGIFVVRDPGYVLVAYGQYSVEASLWTAVILVLVTIAVVWLVYRLVHSALGTGKVVKRVVSGQRQMDAAYYATKGLEHESEGELEKALTAYQFAIDRDQKSALLFLRSAEIANRAGNLVQQDRILDEAEAKFPKLSETIGVHRVQLQYKAGQHSIALESLEKLASKYPRSVAVQRLRAQLYHSERNWQQVVSALTRLCKKSLPDSELLKNKLIEAYRHRLEEAADTEADPIQLKRTWKKIPRAMRNDPKLIGSYCRVLSKLGQGEVAAEVLLQHLRKMFDESLVVFYGSLEIAPEQRIKELKVWIDSHSDSVGAHLALGRLLALTCDFDGARNVLKKGLGIRASAELLEALAQVEIRLNNYQRAAELLLQATECRDLAGLRKPSSRQLAHK